MKRLGVVVIGETKTSKVGRCVKRSSKSKGKSVPKVTPGVGVEKTSMFPEEDSVTRSYMGYEWVSEEAAAGETYLEWDTITRIIVLLLQMVYEVFVKVGERIPGDLRPIEY